VHQHFKEFRARGWIDMGYKRLTLRDPAALAACARDEGVE